MNYSEIVEPRFLPDFNLKYLIDRWGSPELNNIFLAYFGKIPSRYTFGDLDMEKFHKDFPMQFKEIILGVHYQKFNLRDDWQSEFIYVLKDQVLVQKGEN